MSRLDVSVFDSLANKEKASLLEEVLCGENLQDFTTYSKVALAKKKSCYCKEVSQLYPE